jgi:hypothetical protein
MKKKKMKKVMTGLTLILATMFTMSASDVMSKEMIVSKIKTDLEINMKLSMQELNNTLQKDLNKEIKINFLELKKKTQSKKINKI